LEHGEIGIANEERLLDYEPLDRFLTTWVGHRPFIIEVVEVFLVMNVIIYVFPHIR
jgi:hypothetical protein